MKTVSQRLREELRDGLLPLAELCPLQQLNPEDRPLYSVRKMNLLERFEWFDALSEQGLAALAAYHQNCLHAKSGLEIERKHSRPSARSVA